MHYVFFVDPYSNEKVAHVGLLYAFNNIHTHLNMTHFFYLPTECVYARPWVYIYIYASNGNWQFTNWENAHQLLQTKYTFTKLIFFILLIQFGITFFSSSYFAIHLSVLKFQCRLVRAYFILFSFFFFFFCVCRTVFVSFVRPRITMCECNALFNANDHNMRTILGPAKYTQYIGHCHVNVWMR